MRRRALYQKLNDARKEDTVKIVVIRSPRFLRGILKKLFGVK